jgi:hypothetical protein
MMRRNSLFLDVIGILLVVFLASCSSPDGTPQTPEQSSTATVEPSPTETPLATPTPVPSPTEKPLPTPTPIPTPTAEVSPTAFPTPTSTPQSEPTWSSVTDSILGVSLSYPPGFYAVASSPALPFTVQNWDLDTAEWAHFPESGLRIEFAPAAMPASGADAAVYTVGSDDYPGFSEQRYQDVWGTPSRIITIQYSAEGQDWLITGYLSEASPDEGQREELFHAIVTTVSHFPATPAEHESIPADPTLPRAYFSREYLNPEASIRLAFEEFGHTSSLNNPWVQYQLERAYHTQHLYHLATAEPGSFNADTTDFYPWLVNCLRSMSSAAESDKDYLYQMREHSWNQVHTAIYEPDTEIGQRIRQIEAGLDPDFGGWGPEVYWMYLVGAYCESLNPSTPLTRDASARIFNELVSDYTMTQLQDPTLEDFGFFLASRNYFTDSLSCY